MNDREKRIDDAVCNAGELISALLERGPLTKEQTDLVVVAAVRGKVDNAEHFEIRESVARVVRDLEGGHEDQSDNK